MNLPTKTTNPMAQLEEGVVEEEKPKKVWNKNKIYASMLIGVAVVFVIMALTSQYSDEAEVNENINEPPPVGEFAPRFNGIPRTAFVHLFEWKWTDIEKECVNVLAPLGYAAVQVSPPSEHINHRSVPNNPWWTRYQPVSYKLESRSGSRNEFISMVETCNSVGVQIYVDAVLNHMGAASTGVGNAGTPFDPSQRQYEKFGPNDFNYCNPPDIQGSDYSNDAYRVRHCQLVGLPDLKQDSDYVRTVQAEYLQDLINIGVGGFRFDAGKHMEVDDVNQILNKLNGNVYIFSEVIDYGFDAISQSEYTPFYDVTEFRFEATLVDRFTKGRLSELEGIGESFGFMSGLSAVVFVDNHDTQRYENSPLTYRNGATYNLANAFLLAWPYGYPKVMSSYNFNQNDFDKGPPSFGNGDTKQIYNDDGSDNCFKGEWVCEHRYREIFNMVSFKNYVASVEAYEVANWWTNGFQAIAFSRVGPNGAAGFLILNKESYTLSDSWYTGLSDGTYCDVYTSEFDSNTKTCNGRLVFVNGGRIQTEVGAFTGLAIHGGAKL